MLPVPLLEVATDSVSGVVPSVDQSRRVQVQAGPGRTRTASVATAVRAAEELVGLVCVRVKLVIFNDVAVAPGSTR